jgi:hypothetical protein
VTVVLVLKVMVVTADVLVGLLQEYIGPFGTVEVSVSGVSHGVVLGWGPYLEEAVGIGLFSVGLNEWSPHWEDRWTNRVNHIATSLMNMFTRN